MNRARAAGWAGGGSTAPRLDGRIPQGRVLYAYDEWRPVAHPSSPDTAPAPCREARETPAWTPELVDAPRERVLQRSAFAAPPTTSSAM